MHGKIALFDNGEVKFAAAALTGQNTADVMPPDAIAKTHAQQVGVKYKVTPAGRYTVSPVFDPQYGMVLEINENQGPDWSLAIHRVALWNKSQLNQRADGAARQGSETGSAARRHVAAARVAAWCSPRGQDSHGWCEAQAAMTC